MNNKEINNNLNKTSNIEIYNRILLSSAHVNGREMKYIEKAFESGWISPLGPNVDEFEKELSAYINKEYCVALSSGTAAIHLGLKYLGVTDGDDVFCSDLTFSASCNPIVYERATPVFIDSDESFNMSPVALEKAFSIAKSKNKLPKAVVIVDLYGLPAKYNELLPICEKYGVPALSDATEALGSSLDGKKCGSFGELSALSFNGNKIITTSGGGALLTNDKKCAEKIKFWATQSREPFLYYQHEEIGFNYRLSNISAGIGLGQLETLDAFVEKRRFNNAAYKKELSGLPITFTSEICGAFSNYWLTVIEINQHKNFSKDGLIRHLANKNIETRPVWKPMHLQPVFSHCDFVYDENKGIISKGLFENGVCLPSGSNLLQTDLDRVISEIKHYFG